MNKLFDQDNVSVKASPHPCLGTLTVFMSAFLMWQHCWSAGAKRWLSHHGGLLHKVAAVSLRLAVRAVFVATAAKGKPSCRLVTVTIGAGIAAVGVPEYAGPAVGAARQVGLVQRLLHASTMRWAGSSR